jgi:hypothetical protein
MPDVTENDIMYWLFAVCLEVVGEVGARIPTMLSLALAPPRSRTFSYGRGGGHDTGREQPRQSHHTMSFPNLHCLNEQLLQGFHSPHGPLHFSLPTFLCANASLFHCFSPADASLFRCPSSADASLFAASPWPRPPHYAHAPVACGRSSCFWAYAAVHCFSVWVSGAIFSAIIFPFQWLTLQLSCLMPHSWQDPNPHQARAVKNETFLIVLHEQSLLLKSCISSCNWHCIPPSFQQACCYDPWYLIPGNAQVHSSIWETSVIAKCRIPILFNSSNASASDKYS